MKKLFIAIAILFPASAPLWADEAETQALPNADWYLGVVLPHNHIGGDFDGQRLYTNASAIAIVPKLDDAWGLGVTGGIKRRLPSHVGLGIEGTFLHSKHDATWMGATGDATYDALSLDMKLYFNADNPFQPFVQAGVFIPSITVKDGYGTETEIKDVTYSGTGIEGGAGFLYYFNRRFSFQFATVLRRASYDQIDYGSRSKISPKLSTNEMGINFGFNVHFSLDGQQHVDEHPSGVKLTEGPPPAVRPALDSPAVLEKRQKVKDFIVVGYNQIKEDLYAKKGDYLNSLLALLEIPSGDRERAINKIQSFMEFQKTIPGFADRVAEYYVR